MGVDFSKRTGNPRLEEKEKNRVQKSGVAQSKGVGWWQPKDTEVAGKGKIQKTVHNGGAGFSISAGA